MEFSSNPRGLLMIEYGMAFPGWGHQLTTLCYALLHCQENDLYPIIYSRPHSAYGSWEDTFDPFWDKDELDLIYERLPNINKTEVKLADWAGAREGFFGAQWQSLTLQIKCIFDQIYRVKPEVKVLVEERIKSLSIPPVYISAHIRRGDKCGQFKQYGAKTIVEVIDDLLSEIDKYYQGNCFFVMTDDYDVITVLKEATEMKVFSFCSPDLTGDPSSIRTSEGHILTLLADIAIACRSELHFQTVNTRVSKVVRLLRKDAGCKHIYDSQYTVDTFL